MIVAATRPCNVFPGVIELFGRERDKNYYHLYLSVVQLLLKAKLDRQSSEEVDFARLLILVRTNCLVVERVAYRGQHHPGTGLGAPRAVTFQRHLLFYPSFSTSRLWSSTYLVTPGSLEGTTVLQRTGLKTLPPRKAGSR